MLCFCIIANGGLAQISISRGSFDTFLIVTISVRIVKILKAINFMPLIYKDYKKKICAAPVNL